MVVSAVAPRSALRLCVLIVVISQLYDADAAVSDLPLRNAQTAFCAAPALLSRAQRDAVCRSSPAPITRSHRISQQSSVALRMAGESGMKLLQDLLRTLPSTGGYNSFAELFKKYDLDKSGSIDAAELRTALCDMGAQMNEDQVDSLLKSIDANGDGQVDWTEFQNALELAELRILQEWEQREQA